MKRYLLKEVGIFLKEAGILLEDVGQLNSNREPFKK